VKRFLLKNYDLLLVVALVLVMLADIVYWLFIAPQLQNCVAHEGTAPFCQQEVILVGSPQPPSPFPVIFLAQTYPVVFPAVLGVGIVLMLVGVVLNWRGSTARGVVLALETAPLPILIALGLFALLPPV
jgi:hypothetical protein